VAQSAAWIIFISLLIFEVRAYITIYMISFYLNLDVPTLTSYIRLDALTLNSNYIIDIINFK
jgi:hypothetical protein